MDFFDIIQHENFGKKFHGDMRFRTLFERLYAHTINPQVAELRQRFKMDFTPEGRVQFSSRDIGHTFRQSEGETLSDFIQRMTTGFGGGTSPFGDDFFDPARNVPASMLRSAEYITGDRTTTDDISRMLAGSANGYRRLIEDVARDKGLTFRYRTFANKEGISEHLRSSMGDTGLIMPDTDMFRVLEAIDRNGRRLAHNEILRAFGYGPSDADVVAKRLRGAMNRMVLSRTYQDQPLNFAFFDPLSFHMNSNLNKSRFLAQAKRIAELPGETRTVDEIMKDLSVAASDGLSYMKISKVNEMLNMIRGEVTDMERNLARLDGLGRVGTREHYEATENLKSLRRKLDEVESATRNGHSFNMRGIAGTDIYRRLTADFLAYGKGDVIAVGDKPFQKLVDRDPNLRGMTREQRDQIDVLMSAADPKRELRISKTATPFMSLEPVPKAKVAFSNSLTIAALGDLFDPEMGDGSTYITRSLRTSISDAVDAINTGKLTPGLVNLLNDLDSAFDNTKFDSPAQYEAVVQQKRYIQRIRAFVDGGGDLRTNPRMTADLLRIVREHNFQQKKFGNTLKFGDETVPDLAMRVPMMNSTRAHIDTSASTSESVVANPGMTLRVDYSGAARFGLQPLDNAMWNTSWGGSDLDDSLYVSHRYDSKAKRLLALTTRDPNTMGEFALLDSDIIKDKNFSKAVISVNGETVKLQRAMHRRQNILRKLEKMVSKNTFIDLPFDEYQALFRELNGINEAIDQFLRGSKAGVVGIDIGEMFSLDPDKAMRREFAPNGFTTTTKSLNDFYTRSVLRGYSTFTEEEISRGDPWMMLREEVERARRNDYQMPFEYRGEKYRDYFNTPLFSDPYRDPRYAERIRNLEKHEVGRRMSTRRMQERERVLEAARGRLGVNINVAESVNMFARAHSNLKYSDDRLARAVTDAFKEFGGVTVLPREINIDALTKNAVAEVIDIANEITTGNLELVGRVIARLQEQGFTDVGFDPIVAQQRLQGEEIRGALARGYRSVTATDLDDEELFSRMMLNETDRKAYVARRFGQVLTEQRNLATTSAEMVSESMENIMADLEATGFRPSDVEADRARQFIEGYEDDVRKLVTNLKDDKKLTDRMRRILDDGVDDSIDTFTADEIQMRSLKRLKSWGIMGSAEEMNRQMLAIAHTLIESRPAKGRSKLLAPLMQVSTEIDEVTGTPQVSMMELFSRAMNMNKEKILAAQVQTAVNEFTPDQSMAEFIRTRISPLYEGHRSVDMGLYRTTMVNAVQEMVARGGSVDADMSQFLLTLKRTPRESPSTDRINTLLGRVDGSEFDGSNRLAAREAADGTSEGIAKSKIMKRFDMEEMSKLLSVPGFRKGLGVAGIFAGLGIVRAVRGDRSQEDMEGPPLLPGGSNYEEYNTPLPPQSIFATSNPIQPQQGYTYSVRATGNFDPNTMRSSISALTGADVGGTTYTARNTSYSNYTSSMDVINSMYE